MSPSARDWRLYADDVVEACVRIRRFVAGMRYDDVAADERTQDAVIRNLEIIGEAAKSIPEHVLAQAPHVPWRKVRGMRDVLAHGYFDISLNVVWDAATTHIAPLEQAVRALIDGAAPSAEG